MCLDVFNFSYVFVNVLAETRVIFENDISCLKICNTILTYATNWTQENHMLQN